MKKLLITILIFISPLCLLAQSGTTDLPTVGKPMPDFTFNDIQYYSSKTASLKDFRGKWLVLDFWNRYCYTCLDSQPHIDSLQRAFNDKIQFVLVGYTGSQYLKKSDDAAIRVLYERQRKEHDLSLAIAYDSLSFHRFIIRPTPYIIIIDPNGIVRGLTYKIKAKDLEDFLAGRTPVLKKSYNWIEAQKIIKKQK